MQWIIILLLVAILLELENLKKRRIIVRIPEKPEEKDLLDELDELISHGEEIEGETDEGDN